MYLGDISRRTRTSLKWTNKKSFFLMGQNAQHIYNITMSYPWIFIFLRMFQSCNFFVLSCVFHIKKMLSKNVQLITIKICYMYICNIQKSYKCKFEYLPSTWDYYYYKLLIFTIYHELMLTLPGNLFSCNSFKCKCHIHNARNSLEIT